jgi:hypothetical protein
MMRPEWVPSLLLPTPMLGDDRKWSAGPADRHLWREAYDVDRDAIFRDLFTKLKTAP